MQNTEMLSNAKMTYVKKLFSIHFFMIKQPELNKSKMCLGANRGS